MAEIGTRALIKDGGREFEAEIIDVNDRLITTEVRWQNRPIVELDYYRGLYPVAGMDEGSRFELDFNEDDLEALFPLMPGKSVHFSGNMKFVEKGRNLNLEVIMSVKGEALLDLDNGKQKVFVVDIVTQSVGNDGRIRITRNTVYYAADLAMILKSVTHTNGQQRFWRVTRVDKGSGLRRRSRSGTVAI